MRQSARLDFIDHPSGNGYTVTVNGRRVMDCFTHVAEVLAFAQALRTPARYAGTNFERVISEGGRVQPGDENVVA